MGLTTSLYIPFVTNGEVVPLRIARARRIATLSGADIESHEEELGDVIRNTRRRHPRRNGLVHFDRSRGYRERDAL